MYNHHKHTAASYIPLQGHSPIYSLTYHQSPFHGIFTIRGTVHQLKESKESFGFLISSQSGLRRSLYFLLLFGDGNRIQKTSPSVGSGGGNPEVNDRIQDTANTKAQLSLLF